MAQYPNPDTEVLLSFDSHKILEKLYVKSRVTDEM